MRDRWFGSLASAGLVRRCQGVDVQYFDLVVRGGTVVTPGHREVADVGGRDGRIAQVGGAMSGRRELGAHGLLVLPGGIDAHVHLVCAALREALGPREPAWTDDFWTGSLAGSGGAGAAGRDCGRSVPAEVTFGPALAAGQRPGPWGDSLSRQD